jgi:hypothetical protein
MAKVKVAKKAKVWNRGSQDYKQVVMGDEVFIPVGGHVVVSRRQAINIKGHYCGKGVEAQIEVEPIFELSGEGEIYTDHKTGQVFPSREALLKHLGIDEKVADSVKNAPKYICAICEDSFDEKDAFIAHMEKCMAKLKKTKAATA